MFPMTNYSFRSQVLHATIAIMVLGLMAIGMSFAFLPDTFYFWHKSFGLLVLFLMVFRVYFIFKDGRPNLPNKLPFWERKLARFVQYSFYFVLILMPLSGWIMSTAEGYIPSFFGIDNFAFPGIEKNKEIAHFFKESHYYLAWIIGGLIVLHIMGNLKHLFINKDGIVGRMWNFERQTLKSSRKKI
jgi:cytochrome b561